LKAIATPARRASRALAWLLALAPAGLGSAAPRPADVTALDPVGSVLLESRGRPTAPEELSRRLARGGRSSLPTLFSVLARGEFPVRVGERGNSASKLAPDERAAVLSAFGLLPWPEVASFLEERRLAGRGEAERGAALEILGLHGEPEDLPAMVSWCRARPPQARVPRACRQAFERALEALLRRHPTSARLLPATRREADVTLLPPIVAALGKQPSELALQTLAELLGGTGPADVLVLAEIGHVARVARFPAPVEVCERVRPHLDSPEDALRREAALACGRLQDPEAIPRLIALLDDGDENVRARACEALAEIAGEELGSDPALWSNWHADLVEAWSLRAPELLGQARYGSPPVASRAILELTKLQPYRHELAQPLCGVLDRPEEELVSLACAALGHLGSKAAVRPLLARLNGASISVRRAAYQALRRITEEDHGEDPAAWQAAGW